MEIVGDMCQPYYPNPDAVVYNVSIPYRGGIPGGIYDGKMIEISGSVPYGAHRFEINLNTGYDPSSDRALHISCRFDQHCVVRNSYERGCWSIEERQGSFPFSPGREFTLMIMGEMGCYRIAVNNQHCWEFNHRLPMERVNSISIDGSVQIHKIEFIDRMNPGVGPGICPIPAIPSFPAVPSNPGTCTIPAYPAFPPTTTCVIPPPEQLPGYIPGGSNLAPVYNPPIPYAYPIYGGLKSGMMIYISGRPSASAQRFTINFQNGTAPYPPPDVAFHFDARFFSRSVVRNSRCNNTWASEENLVAHFPFQPAVNFDIIIRVEFEKFMVAVNGQHFVEFRHRLKPLDRFDTLYIENDVIVSSIRFA